MRLKRTKEVAAMINNNPLLEVQSLLSKHGILISFSGKLTQGLIEEYGEAVKTYLELEDRPQNVIFHVFSIFIEQTQNIKNYCNSMKHSALYEQISQSSIVTIGKTENGSYTFCGNLVAKEHIDPLVARIEQLSAMDKTGLKKLYKEILKMDLPPDAQSAGLGLVDMARKATRPLEYTVTPVNEQLSFFTLKAVV
jgi:hypothetical protein